MSRSRTPTFVVAATVVAAALAAGGYALYATGMSRGMAMAPLPAATGPAADAAATAGAAAPTRTLPRSIAEGEEATRRHISTGIKAGDVDPEFGSRVLYYHDPMVPGRKFDAPAKSPFMDMMLVPAYADGDGDSSRITVSPRIQQNLGVRTAAVVEGTISPEVDAVGSIAWNERDQAVVPARASGFVERLHARATLDRVAAGQPLAELYVPDWVAAQEEYLALRRMDGRGLEPLVDAARQRMRQAGMNDDQIAQVEQGGAVRPRITLVAPIGGIVTELNAREGMAVSAGTALFRISGTGNVWAHAEVPESQAALLRPGTRVRATSPAAPGTRFDGRVQALLPEIDATTRTLKARVQFANPGNRLVPGMFVRMSFETPAAGRRLLVPSEALIRTGRRTLAMVAEDDGRFRPVEVETGLEAGDRTEIVSGLKAGQRVVVSSQFLIDSEASLRGVETRLGGGDPAAAAGAPGAASAASPAAAAPALQRHPGRGVVVKVDAGSVTLDHGPIETMKMGAMKMDFRLPKAVRPPKLAAGDRVDFEFVLDEDDGPTLTSIQPAAGAAK